MSRQEGISAGELAELLERYRIGKKPLAALLGWGATTVMRYMEGGCPVGEYAEHLKRIYQEPSYYLEFLEEHQERLTPVAYRKSREAVLQYLASSGLWCGAQYLIRYTGADISPFRIVMTLFYAQAFSLGLGNNVLFSEECDLDREGEVPYAGLYEQLRQNTGRRSFEAGGLLAPEEEFFLGAAYEMLLWYGPAELKAVFAAERRYIRTGRTGTGGRKMKNEAVAAYFRKIVQSYKISRPEEFHRYFAERTGRKRRKTGSPERESGL